MSNKIVRSSWMKPVEWTGNYKLACAARLHDWFKFPGGATIRLWASQREAKHACRVELGRANPVIDGAVTITYFELDDWFESVSEEFGGARSFYVGVEYKP